MADVERTIEYRFIAKAEEAIETFRKVNEEIELAKEELRIFAKESRSSIDEAVKELKRLARGAQEFQKNVGTLEAPRWVLDTDKFAQYAATLDRAAESFKLLNKQEEDHARAFAQRVKMREALMKKAFSIEMQLHKISLDEQRKKAAEERELAISSAATVKEKAVVARQLAIKAEQEYQAAQENTKQKMKEVLLLIQQQAINQTEAGARRLAAAEQEAQAANKTSQGLKVIATDADRAAKSLEKAAASTGKLTSSLQNLAGALQIAFGVGIFQIISRLTSAFSDLTKESLEFAGSLFRLGVSVRALQKRGLDITIASTTQKIRALREEFSFFTTKELVDGIGMIQLLTRNFEFTEIEMDNTLRMSAALAVVLGEDVNEAARKMALFFSSGYAESLQRAGIAVNRLTVEEEAHRMGMEGSYKELTEAERSHAAYNLVMRQGADLLEEFNNFMESSYGKIVSTQKAIEEKKNIIGLKLLPVLAAWTTAQLYIINGLEWLLHRMADLIGLGAQLWANVVAPFIGLKIAIDSDTESLKDFLVVWRQAQEMAQEQLAPAIREEVKKFKESLDLADMMGEDYTGLPSILPPGEEDPTAELLKGMGEDFIEAYFEMLEDIKKANEDFYEDLGNIATVGEGGVLEVTEASLEARNTLYEHYNSKFANTNEDGVNEILENEAEFMASLGDIDEEGLQELAEIWIDYYRRLEDIQIKTQQKLEDARTDYLRDIDDLGIDVQQKQADAARKYRDNEIRAERDFREKMLRLKEKFLFDLEDALRENDAKQILRLIRRYELEKRQAQRDYDNDKQDREDRYKQELRDIQIWAQRRREELWIEFQRRQADIALQAEREREDAERERKRAYEELQADIAAQREERLNEYKEEIDDIRDAFQNKLIEIVEEVFPEFQGSTGDFIEVVGKMLNSLFGANGYAEDVFSVFMINLNTLVSTMAVRVQEVANMLSAIETMNAQMNLLMHDPVSNPPILDLPIDLKMAEGGVAIAHSPTTALFGEQGSEAAIFIPLNKMANLLDNLSNATITGSPTVGGKLTVELFLSPDLEARVIDDTLNASAHEILTLLGVRK